MWPQFSADLVTFNEEILNGKLHFFVQCKLIHRLASFKYWQTSLYLPELLTKHNSYFDMSLLLVITENIHCSSGPDFGISEYFQISEYRALKYYWSLSRLLVEHTSLSYKICEWFSQVISVAVPNLKVTSQK